MAINEVEVEGFEFDADAVNEIDQESVEFSGPSFPTVQWHYGDPKMRKMKGMEYYGGFFVKSDMVDEKAMLAAGWEKTTWAHGVGAEEDGFYRREIAVSVLGMRHRWEVTSDDGPRRVFAWNQYKEACAAASPATPSSRLHVLVLLKGLEALGPFVMTLKGSAALAFEGNRNSPGALPRFAQTVVRKANMESEAKVKADNEKGATEAKAAGKPFTPKPKRMWAYRAFWLPIGAKRDKDGEPLFIEVGKKDKKHICPPEALALPDKAEKVELKRFYVGGDMLNHVNQLYADNAEWMKAWDNLLPGATENGAIVAAHEDTPDKVDDEQLTALGM